MKHLYIILVFYCVLSNLYSSSIRKNKQYGGNQGGYAPNQGGYAPNQGGYQNYQQGSQPNYNFNQPPPGQRPMRCNTLSDCPDCGYNVKQCHIGTCFCCQGKTCYCQKLK